MIYNILSLLLASMVATTLFLWMRVPQIDAIRVFRAGLYLRIPETCLRPWGASHRFPKGGGFGHLW